ncbi:MAG: hypothetical protein QE487_06670 [Fluviicola sp.]|nr:hypothetical protein [Fluviicola sp.]
MDKYLTPELKAYYMNDFNEKVVPFSEESWKLDDGVLEYLQTINRNPLIQTLYSKKYNINKSVNNDSESYLMFTYARELEDKLFKVFLSQTTSAFSYGDDSKCYFTFTYPEIEEEEEDDEEDDNRVNIGCVRDGNYFNINRIWVHFVDYGPNSHVRFWEFVSKELCELTHK